MVTDTEESDNVLAQHCDLVGLPPFNIDYYAPALRAGASLEAHSALASAALGMMQDGTMMAIQNKYYGEKMASCYTGAAQTSVSVTFDQVRAAVAGLHRPAPLLQRCLAALEGC